MTGTVLFEERGGVAHVSINRGERHNALGCDEINAIRKVLASLAADTRVVLISAEGGRTFCAGADLEQLSSGKISGDQFQSMTNQLAQLSVPTICALGGNVFGGGVELAISCDFRLGADDIMMRVPAAAIGLCYPIDGIERIVARLGVSTAKRILVGAEELSAGEMRELGILTAVYPPADLMSRANALAARIARLAPLSVGAMLSVIGQAEKGQIDRAHAAQLAERCLNSQDLQEGFAAQRERRKPVFTGS